MRAHLLRQHADTGCEVLGTVIVGIGIGQRLKRRFHARMIGRRLLELCCVQPEDGIKKLLFHLRMRDQQRAQA